MSDTMALDLDEDIRRAKFMRHANQFKFFLIGTGLLAASITVSRRSAVREIAAAFPKFYTPNKSLEPLDKTNNLWRAEGHKLAAKALGLATVNTMAFGMMLTGGIGWAFDLSNMGEVGQRTREVIRRSRVDAVMTPEQRKKEEEEVEELWNGLIGDKFGVNLPGSAPKDTASAADATTDTSSDNNPKSQ